jgi:predicted dehydrogenase
MSDRPVIGVISSEPTDLGLAAAAARHPGLKVRSLAVDAPRTDDIAGIVVDVPLGQRAELVARLAARWPVPILIESPVAADLAESRAVESLLTDNAIVAANPLRYGLHTRRLAEEIAQADDSVQTFFAAWRFRAPATAEHALPQLLDYLRLLGPDEPWRISAMHHRQPSIMTAVLRYAADVFGSIEVGGHLPESFPSASELVIECFGQASAYSCLPGNQAVQLYGRDHAAYEWQPAPADAIVAAFADWLGGAARPAGSIANDLTILRLVDRISQALQAGGVLDAHAV